MSTVSDPMQLAAEMGAAVGGLATSAHRGTLLEQLLNPIPALGINDRIMLSFVDPVLVPNAPGIDRVGQNVIEVTAVKGAATGDRPIKCGGPARPKATLLGFCLHRSYRASLFIEILECA
ncbi:MAG: hypothetical protein AAF307_06680, partial [Pseudomonadota bacterium]